MPAATFGDSTWKKIERNDSRNGVGMHSGTKWILLAEDDPRDAQLTTRALAESKAPGEVIIARDGAEALDYLFGRGPASHSGDPGLKTIPVVMLTSSRQERDVAESYQLGANAYVVKPVSFAEFRTALKEVGSFWTVINELPPQTVVT